MCGWTLTQSHTKKREVDEEKKVNEDKKCLGAPLLLTHSHSLALLGVCTLAMGDDDDDDFNRPPTSSLCKMTTTIIHLFFKGASVGACAFHNGLAVFKIKALNCSCLRLSSSGLSRPNLLLLLRLSIDAPVKRVDGER